MSNAVKRMGKKVSGKLPFELSLFGSIVAAVAMVSLKTYDEAKEYYKELGKNKKWFKGKSVLDICNKVWGEFGSDEAKNKSRLALLWDERDILTPMVAVCTDDGIPMPNSPSGKPFGVIGHYLEGRDYIGMEWLYDEDGNEYAEEGTDYEEID